MQTPPVAHHQRAAVTIVTTFLSVILISGGLTMPALAAALLPDALEPFTLLGYASVVFGILGFVAAYGLWNLRPWARPLALGAGALGLVIFPLGTVLGIATFWYLLDPRLGTMSPSRISAASPLCPRCRTTVDLGATACPSCGASLQAVR